MFSVLQNRLLPLVPEHVRDDLTMLQFGHLRSQIPLLYLSLILLIISATMAAGDALSPTMRYGIPLVISLLCIVRLLVWVRRAQTDVAPEKVRGIIRNMSIISGIIAAACSYWCVRSWLGSDLENKAYFPLFMSMGSLSTAYCLSTIRLGALVNLGIGLPPMIFVLLLSGRNMDVAAASSMIVATTFLLRMIHQQHSQLVAMLDLQSRMTTLADTDALTGLMNRRALHARFDRALQNVTLTQGPALVLVDLDGFKPVNDRHGHLVGDDVLRQVARRFQVACAGLAEVARLGGDEFAVLIPADSRASAADISNRLMTSLLPPIHVDDVRLRIGASAGSAQFPQDGHTPDMLIKVADDALYAAKAESRAQEMIAALPSGASEALAS